MTPLVEIRGLLVRREKRVALEVARLTIERGEILAVAGPNGAGKTTLLLVLARLLKPERGEILFDGRPVTARGDLDYRRRIGLVMQDSLLLNRSVFDNVALGLRFRRLPGPETCRRVDEWLERLGISHLRPRPALQLSGGEARRVALARAFALQPDLLLLDEPFSALDRASRHKLQDDLKTILAGANIATVFSTHSETDVQKLADRKIELDGGKLEG
ncbi:MAG: ABC-type nitrate/sulfonate/bicarbonate transport system ATPase component [Anaerolineaceae bacterium]|nr:MAG: ABC-type nitrate/sulfonate/bicarbonate transport system ATPase component [Anaerolineaceae bacterium]